jgi:hypothetical protein
VGLLGITPVEGMSTSITGKGSAESVFVDWLKIWELGSEDGRGWMSVWMVCVVVGVGEEMKWDEEGEFSSSCDETMAYKNKNFQLSSLK